MTDLLEASLVDALREAEDLERRTDEMLIDATQRSAEAKRLVAVAITSLRRYRATRSDTEKTRAETVEIRRQRDAARLSTAFGAAGEA